MIGYKAGLVLFFRQARSQLIALTNESAQLLVFQRAGGHAGNIEILLGQQLLQLGILHRSQRTDGLALAVKHHLSALGQLEVIAVHGCHLAVTAHLLILQQHQRQIAVSQAVVQEHERLSRWMARMEGREEDWHVVELPALLFLPHTDLYTFLDDPRIYEVLSGWTPYMPMVKSCLRITAAKDGGSPAYCWGLGVRQDFAQEYGLPTNGVLEVLPARKAFVLDYCGWQVSPGESPLQKHYERFLSRMEALNLRPVSSVYLTVLFHTHDADGTRRDHGYMAAAVE